VFDSFRGSFVIASRSIRDHDLRVTVETIRSQDLVEWECVLFIDDPVHEWDLIELSRYSPRFRVGTTDAWNPWNDIRSDLAIHVTPGTKLTTHAFSTLVNVDMRGVSLLYGDSTETVRPNWSPVRYRHDHYFGDVVALKRDVDPGSIIRRIPETLSAGGRQTFPVVPRAEAAAIAECAKGLRPLSISVIVPTAGLPAPGDSGSRAMILDLVASLGSHDDTSILVVADSTTPTSVTSELSSTEDVRVITYEKPFNFSDKCNIGAFAEDSDVVFFLNDDMTCLTPNWPDHIRSSLSMKRVGAVGGLLLKKDGLVQCAGHGNSPVPHLFGVDLDPNDPTNHAILGTQREVSGLSGACIAMRRDDYLQVGGMCVDLAEGYNDVDLGFKVLSVEKSLLFNPALRFVHFESASRDPSVNTSEFEFVSRRWGRFFDSDPYTP
jgi:GT2 family glycosyltransferase